MTRYRKLVSSALLASSLGFLAAPVAAVPPEGGFLGPRGDFSEHRARRAERHHQKLHEALKLMPDQESAWKKLLDSEHPMARAESRIPADWTKLTTPERADIMLERMKEQQVQQTEHVAALKEFYSALTPEQRKIFDDFHSGPRNGMRGKSIYRSSAPEKAPQKP